MKNREFFYRQYDKINWENQEKTKINSFVNNFVINQFLLKRREPTIRIFDVGFGIGYFFRMLNSKLSNKYSEMTLSGCEPSAKNYDYFSKHPSKFNKNVKIQTYNKPFQDIKVDKKFDFLTAIYVFPHFTIEDLDIVTQKIHSMLKDKGKFILVVANEKYLEKKLKDKRDLFIEKSFFEWNGKKYWEVLHYSDIPEIGKVIDYNREENFYLDLFKKNSFALVQKKDLNDNGFICTVFIFEKE